MPNNDREVFEHLTSDRDTPVEIDFLTYATFAAHKREWMREFEDKHSIQPTQADIDGWIGNLTELQFTSMRADAAGFFDAAAREYLKDDMKAAVEQAKQAEIVTAVTAASGFWKQFFIALLTSILTPLVIGGVIGLGLLYSSRFPTPADIATRLGPVPLNNPAIIPKLEPQQR